MDDTKRIRRELTRHALVRVLTEGGSEAFWYGFVCGFAPQRFLLSGRDVDVTEDFDSVCLAWQSVGEVLKESLDRADDLAEETESEAPDAAAKAEPDHWREFAN